MTCAQFFQPFVDWIHAKQDDEDRYLKFILVSNDKEGPARYAEGELHLKTLLALPPNHPTTVFAGTATLFESNEQWSEPPPANWPPDQFWVTSTNPFSPYSTDKITVQILIANGRITLKSNNKGHAIIENPQCASSLLFGFANQGSGALGVGGSIFAAAEPVPESSRAPSDEPGTTPPILVPLPVVRPYYVLSFQRVKIGFAH